MHSDVHNDFHFFLLLVSSLFSLFYSLFSSSGRLDDHSRVLIHTMRYVFLLFLFTLDDVSFVFLHDDEEDQEATSLYLGFHFSCSSYFSFFHSCLNHRARSQAAEENLVEVEIAIGSSPDFLGEDKRAVLSSSLVRQHRVTDSLPLILFSILSLISPSTILF